VFENPVTGRAWADERQQRLVYFHPTLAALGLRKRDAYQTRHTYASLALSGGVPPAYIASQLGHKNTAMLFQHYGKYIAEAAGTADRDRLEQIMMGGKKPAPRLVVVKKSPRLVQAAGYFPPRD
jgi:integrase